MGISRTMISSSFIVVATLFAAPAYAADADAVTPTALNMIWAALGILGVTGTACLILEHRAFAHERKQHQATTENQAILTARRQANDDVAPADVASAQSVQAA